MYTSAVIDPPFNLQYLREAYTYSHPKAEAHLPSHSQNDDQTDRKLHDCLQPISLARIDELDNLAPRW